MSSGTEWHSNALALKVHHIGFVDFERRGHDAVVVFRVAHSNVDGFNVLACGCSNHEGRHTLADGNLHVARSHCSGHCGTGVERHPVDFDAHFFFVDAVSFGVLEWHRPLEEVGDSDLTAVATSHSSLSTCQHREGPYGAHKFGFHTHNTSPGFALFRPPKVMPRPS